MTWARAGHKLAFVTWMCLLLLLCWHGLTFQVQARFSPEEIQIVPADRLIRNLEARVNQNPTNGFFHVELARAFSLAYSQRAYGTTNVMIGSPSSAYSIQQGLLKSMRIASETNREPNEYLTNAIAQYQRAAQLGQANVLTFLGLGWCLMENRQTNLAILHLRKAFELSKSFSQAVPRFSNGDRYMGDLDLRHEIYEYLMSLLDPVADAREIAKLKKEKPNVRPGFLVTPIIVPLDNEFEPEKLVDRNAHVVFDLDGRNVGGKWQWILPNSGWLAYCPPGSSGKITSGRQLFGDVTFWLFWKDGFEALASLDDDQNGILEGAELENLCIWRDENSNGIPEHGEIKTLVEWGIDALGLANIPGTNGTLICPQGARFGSSWRPTFDIIVVGVTGTPGDLAP